MDPYYARKAVESLVSARKRERLLACPAADLPADAAKTSDSPPPPSLPELGGLSLRESAALVAVGSAVGDAGGGEAAAAANAAEAARVVRRSRLAHGHCPNPQYSSTSRAVYLRIERSSLIFLRKLPQVEGVVSALSPGSLRRVLWVLAGSFPSTLQRLVFGGALRCAQRRCRLCSHPPFGSGIGLSQSGLARGCEMDAARRVLSTCSPLAAELLFSKLEQVDADDEARERAEEESVDGDGDGGGGGAAEPHNEPPFRVVFYARFYGALGDEREALERVLGLKEAFAREALEGVVQTVLSVVSGCNNGG